MNIEKLNDIANRMVAPGKGILAADESTGSITKRFESIKLESTETSRRDYREMLFRSGDAMKSYISGVILFDETLRQKAADGTPLVDIIKAAGAVPGIKLDKGPKPLPFCPGETVTEGLDGLAERVAEYAKLGAEFAKWRAVIDVSDTIPSHNAISANAHALARYAAICQQGGIVPMVEPEVLMDGAHTIDRCMEATEWALKETFQQLYFAGVALEGIILKPNMVISGKKCATQASREEVAEKTLKVLKRCVPGAVPGIAFLSGGQSGEDATAHLHLMNAAGPLPWKLTFSYGRALQADALKAWAGRPENVAAGQRALAHRAKMNALAASGRWTAEQEKVA
ncbi:class I fructose-bisphosphate aldolase [Aestuariivirga sp.]|jgi:fructose-bisphosphate aldolase class I|uniref:class I fructose-bisphosphate aldolase n=1 Tax=Aestuariivirga sp. TaxID=2650926 RepID=UPI003783B5B8